MGVREGGGEGGGVQREEGGGVRREEGGGTKRGGGGYEERRGGGVRREEGTRKEHEERIPFKWRSTTVQVHHSLDLPLSRAVTSAQHFIHKTQ